MFNFFNKKEPSSEKLIRQVGAVVELAKMAIILANMSGKALSIEDDYIVGYGYGCGDKINQSMGLIVGTEPAKIVVESIYLELFGPNNNAFDRMIELTQDKTTAFLDGMIDGGNEMGEIALGESKVATRLFEHLKNK